MEVSSRLRDEGSSDFSQSHFSQKGLMKIFRVYAAGENPLSIRGL
jgi:hypothetical protein